MLTTKKIQKIKKKKNYMFFKSLMLSKVKFNGFEGIRRVLTPLITR